MRTGPLLFLAVVLACVTTTALPASAEWFADFYIGGAFTSSDDLTTTFGSTVDTLNGVDRDNSFAFGGRGGYWFETAIYRRLNFGLALDVFHFQPDIDGQVVSGIRSTPGRIASETFILSPIDLSVTALSFDLMLRWPLLQTAQFPKGQLQPYFTIGPAIFIAKAGDSTNFVPVNQSDTDTSVGVKLGAGLAWHLLRNLAVFGEYRFTHFSPKWSFTDGGVPGTLETDINTHYLLVGASYRF